MANGFINVSVGQDLTANMLDFLKTLEKKTVCVGIPQEENTVHEGGKIKEAELLFIHTNGIRRRSMINEMNESMDTTADGMPSNPNYTEFTDNMSKGMSYSAAYQLYITAHGSPLWHSPPRPVIEPAIEDDKEIISGILKESIISGLYGDLAMSEQKLNEAGLEGQAASQEWFTSPKNEWAKNSPKTIKIKGSDMPLIDTGAMRKAITYVIKNGDNDD